MANNEVTEYVVKSLVGFDRNTIENYKNLYARGASDDELILFMRVCKATGLSPEKRQIYLIGRYDKKLGKTLYSPQTSVDGLRAIAERSGKYEGQTPVMWCGKDGMWKDLWVPTKEEPYPFAAKVGVFKTGCREATYAVARWEAYVQTYYTKDNGWQVGSMWKKMGDNQLAKCAESLALRKAFPDESHGLYTQEEMAQAREKDVTSSVANMSIQERIKEADKLREEPKAPIVQSDPAIDYFLGPDENSKAQDVTDYVPEPEEQDYDSHTNADESAFVKEPFFQKPAQKEEQKPEHRHIYKKSWVDKEHEVCFITMPNGDKCGAKRSLKNPELPLNEGSP